MFKTEIMTRIIFFLFFALFGMQTYAANKTWTCINKNGETMFRTEAIHVSEFKNGLAKVYKNTLVDNEWITGYGYINTKGEVVIPCSLKKANDFNADVTFVQFEGEDFYTLIDKNGNRIPCKKYDDVKNFYPDSQSLCAVYEDGKIGFINTQGFEVIPCIYLGSSVFSNGLASVCLASSEKGEYGFINEKGEVVIPLKFIQTGTSSFSNGLARASVGGKTVLIDTIGKVVFKTDKGNIQGHNFGLVEVITKPNRKGWGWVNFKDEFVIQPTYDYAVNFNEDGYAIVERDGLKGAIDTTGKVVIPLRYETVYCDISKDGFFACVYPSKGAVSMANAAKDYFDKDLNLLSLEDVKYLTAANGGDYLLFSTNTGRIGYMNRAFEIVIPGQYSRAYQFSEGFAWVQD